VELSPAFAPVATIPLTDRGRDVALLVVDVVLTPQRKLPADLGLEGERVDAPI
jgi:hypothetical protein